MFEKFARNAADDINRRHFQMRFLDILRVKINLILLLITVKTKRKFCFKGTDTILEKIVLTPFLKGVYSKRKEFAFLRRSF